MVHRAIFGSLERFAGGLIEHFAAWFPVWICPTPVAVLPITEEQMPAAQELFDQIRAAGFRAVLKSDGPLRKRVRESELDKIPYMAVVGAREAETGEVNVRVHGKKQQTTLKVADFIAALNLKRSSKSLDYGLEIES